MTIRNFGFGRLGIYLFCCGRHLPPPSSSFSLCLQKAHSIRSAAKTGIFRSVIASCTFTRRVEVPSSGLSSVVLDCNRRSTPPQPNFAIRTWICKSRSAGTSPTSWIASSPMAHSFWSLNMTILIASSVKYRPPT